MYQRFFERERNARREAEKYLEDRSLELYLSNQKLAALAAELEKEIARTKADLKRQKELEGQLAHAHKMESVGQLAAGVAHELNTPIQFVGDNIDFLKTSFGDVELLLRAVDNFLQEGRNIDAVSDHVRKIEELRKEIDLDFIRKEVPMAASQALDGTQTLARIVKTMKVFSHPGTESFETVNLNQLIQSALIVSKSEWKYHAQLVEELCEDLPPVECLPGELSQAFLNLIVNAANAMKGEDAGKESRLTIRTRLDGDHVVAEFSDTGCGIEPEIRHRIFDPFFTTKSVGEGTGQGLSICYRIIVKLHKGSLKFQSTIGTGTTFQVRLPVTQNSANKAGPE